MKVARWRGSGEAPATGWPTAIASSKRGAQYGSGKKRRIGILHSFTPGL